MSCNNLDLTIQKGETWVYTIMWGVLPFIYKLITGVPQLAPVRLTVISHGLTDDWRVAISDVEGMTQLNAEGDPPWDSEYHAVTVVDGMTIEINDIVALSFDDYTSGGVIRFHTPVDLTGYEVRMEIREAVGGALIWSGDDAGGEIVIDIPENKITITIDAADTAAITQRVGVYSVEAESAGGVVTQLLAGNIEFVEEVTTT